MGRKKRKWYDAINKWDVLFTFIPLLVGVVCCVIYLFPWSTTAIKNNRLISFFTSNISIRITLLSLFIPCVKLALDMVIRYNNALKNMSEAIEDMSEEIETISEKYTQLVHDVKGIPTADEFLVNRHEIESIGTILHSATSLKYSGGHLNSIILHQDLSNYLKNGGKARFILANPLDENIVALYAEKLMVQTKPGEFKHYVMNALVKLYDYKEKGYDVDFRVYSYLPAFGLQIVEENSKNRIYVELYTMKTDLAKRMLFPVALSNSGEMYKSFEEQFDTLWRDSMELKDVPKLEGLIKTWTD